MSLKEIMPGVFVISVPDDDAQAFKRFFAAFHKSFMEDEISISEGSSPRTPPPRMSNRRQSPFPEPPIPSPVTPPWMSHGVGSSKANHSDEPAIKAQHQQPRLFPASGEAETWLTYARSPLLRTTLDEPPPPAPFPSSYLDPLKGRAIHTDLDEGSGGYPPPTPPAPAYPNPPKGRTVGGSGEGSKQARPASTSSYDSQLAAYLVPGPKPARPHKPDLPPNAPQNAAHQYIAYDMSTLQSAKAQGGEKSELCVYCVQGTGCRVGGFLSK